MGPLAYHDEVMGPAGQSSAIPLGDEEIGSEQFCGPKMSMDPVGSKVESTD